MRYVLLASFVAAIIGTASSDSPTPRAAIDSIAPAFTLKDANGQEHSLQQYRGKLVVLEWTNLDCPFVKKHYDSNNMQKLQQTYSDKGVVWLSICSSAEGKQGHFEPKVIRERLGTLKATRTTYLIDADGTVGKTYGARTTPHIFIIDPQGRLLYAGAIDDRPTPKKEDVEGATNYVAAALDEALSGKPLSQRTTQPYGCSVKY